MTELLYRMKYSSGKRCVQGSPVSHIIVLKASRPKPPGFLDKRPYIWRGGVIVRNNLLSDIIWQLIYDPISEK